MKEPTVSILVPLFNEKESLSELVAKLEKLEASRWKIIEYIFVDDGSSDGSFDILRALKNKCKRKCVLLRFRKNLGKSPALSAGFGYAQGQYIVMMDADLQDEPSEITSLLETLDLGNDLVIGWRKNRQDPSRKKLSSYLFNTFVAWVYHVRLHDMNSGLKACRREVLEEITLYGELHRYFPVLAASAGFSVTEVPVIHHARTYGKSKFGSGRILHAFFDLLSTKFLTVYKHEPMQVFGLFGSIGILLGLIILSYLSYLHFIGQSISRRPLLFLGMLFVLFGMQMVSTGLLGELIIHKDKDKQSYPLAEVID